MISSKAVKLPATEELYIFPTPPFFSPSKFISEGLLTVVPLRSSGPNNKNTSPLY